jgi:DNA-binding MarR family transcriptional regulator
MMDFTHKKGAGAFGTRMRRLSERLDRDISNLYGGVDVVFEPRWFPVVALLKEEEPLSVTEIAARLGLTHPAVSQVVRQLKDENLITSIADENDERRRLLTLTAEARIRCRKLEPLWRAIVQATEDLIVEEVPDLLKKLDALDRALDTKSMSERARDYLNKSNP